MDDVRYYVALVTFVSFPPPILCWFLVHPFADKWRRIGVIPCYTFLAAFLLLAMLWLWSVRDLALVKEFGTHWWLVTVSLVPFGAGVYMRVLWARTMKKSTLLGLDELKGTGSPEALVTTGIHARIRHPRYVEGFLVLVGLAVFVNYLTLYILALAYIPLIYLVALLEERELRARFGRTYEDYAARVPRFIPSGETSK